MQFIAVEVFIYLSVYLIVKLCLFVQKTEHVLEWHYQPIASVFFDQFCLLIKKLILECDTI